MKESTRKMKQMLNALSSDWQSTDELKLSCNWFDKRNVYSVCNDLCSLGFDIEFKEVEYSNSKVIQRFFRWNGKLRDGE